MGTHPKVLLLPSRTHIDARVSNPFLKTQYWTYWTSSHASASLRSNCPVVFSSRKVFHRFRFLHPFAIESQPTALQSGLAPLPLPYPPASATQAGPGGA